VDPLWKCSGLIASKGAKLIVAGAVDAAGVGNAACISFPETILSPGLERLQRFNGLRRLGTNRVVRVHIG
jgi:hypothetical protein